MMKMFRALLIAAVSAVREYLTFATFTGAQVGDSVKLNDGMATGDKDWSAYPSDTTVTGDYTLTDTATSVDDVNHTIGIAAKPTTTEYDGTISCRVQYLAYTPTGGTQENSYYIKVREVSSTFSVVGTLTNNNGVYSGFSSSNYINTVPFSYDMNIGDKFEFGMRYLCSSYYSWGCLIACCNWYLKDKTTSTFEWGSDNFTTSNYDTFNIPHALNKWYYLKLECEVNSNNTIDVKISLSEDKINWTSDTKTGLTRGSSTKIMNNVLSFPSRNSDEYLRGNIDLKECYVKYNGVETKFWQYSNLYDNTFNLVEPQPTYTIQNVGLANASVVGTLTNNNGVYSGFSSSNYIVIPNDYKKTNAEYTFKIRPTDVNTLQVIAHAEKLFTLEIANGGYSGYLTTYSYGTNNSYQVCALNANQDYWIKVIINGTSKTIRYSTDGINYSDYTITDTGMAILTNYQFRIGISSWDSTCPFLGSVDMINTYCIINNITTPFYIPTQKITITSETPNIVAERTPSNDLAQDVIATISTIDNTTIQTATVSTPTIGYTDHLYHAYTNGQNSYYTKDEDAGESLANASIVGTLTNNNGVYSGFSSSNYISIPNSLNLGLANSWEIQFKVKTSNSINTSRYPMDGVGQSFANFGIQNSYWNLFLKSGSGSGWDITGNNGTGRIVAVSTNTEYLLNLSFNGAKYVFKVSTDNGANWTTAGEQISSTKVNNVANFKIGNSNDGLWPWADWIDITSLKITIDGVETRFWQYSTLYDNTLNPVEPQPTYILRSADLTNCSEVGTLTKNNGIYSGFDSSNYINITNPITYQNSYKWVFKITTPAFSTGINAILAKSTSGTETELYINTGSSVCRLTLYAADIGSLNGTNSLSPNSDYFVAMGYSNGSFRMYSDDGSHSSYTIDEVPELTDTSFWRTEGNAFNTDPFNNMPVNIGFNINTPATENYKGSIDMKNCSFTADGVVTKFYSKGITITSVSPNVTYLRNSSNDISNTEYFPAVITTSANVTKSNNDAVITDGSYHLFNITVPTGKTAYIQSSGISYQTADMPLLLPKDTGVGVLLKDGNNNYYRNHWVITKDFDLHYQELEFSTNVQDPTISVKINGVPTPAPWYLYTGDTASYTITAGGYYPLTGTTSPASYSSQDGSKITITATLTPSVGTVDVTDYSYTMDNNYNMTITGYTGTSTTTTIPNMENN